MIYIVCALLLGLVGLNVWVSLTVIRSGLFEPSRKLVQVLVVWLAPICGPIIVYYVYNEARYGEPSDKPFRDGGFAEAASTAVHLDTISYHHHTQC